MKEIMDILKEIKNIELITKRGEKRYEIKIKKMKEESLMLELILQYPNNLDKNSLPNLWYKNKLTNKILENFFLITTYTTRNKKEFINENNYLIKNRKIQINELEEINETNLKKAINRVIKDYES